MSNTFKQLESTFDITSDETEYSIIPAGEQQSNLPTEYTDDEKFIESELRNSIDVVNNATKSILELAEISESPRAYEVAATMIKTKLDALKELKELKNKPISKSEGGTVVHNNTQINGVFPTNINDVLKKLQAQK